MLFPSTATQILVALIPLLSFTNAAHNPPHLRHRRIASSLQLDVERSIDGVAPAIAQVAPRTDSPHAKAKRAITGAVQKRGPKQQCRPRNPSPLQSASSVTGSTAAASTSSSSAVTSSSSSAAPAAESSTIHNQGAWAQSSAPTSQASSTTTSSAAAQPTPSYVPAPQGGSSGLLQLTDGACGWCGSSDDAPNGSEDWLNCGLNGGGWTPPLLTLDKLIYKPLTADGVFAPCKDYFWAFEQSGAQYGVPPILLASFAMQESTCNPSVTGKNREAGLMQITEANCKGAPDGNCYDLAFNVGRGAKIFSDLVNDNHGNVLIAAGGYNGWQKGMTVDDGTRAKWQGNCHAQNNLDYLHQLFNGWIQGRNGYSLGSYFNLNGC